MSSPSTSPEREAAFRRQRSALRLLLLAPVLILRKANRLPQHPKPGPVQVSPDICFPCFLFSFLALHSGGGGSSGSSRHLQRKNRPWTTNFSGRTSYRRSSGSRRSRNSGAWTGLDWTPQATTRLGALRLQLPKPQFGRCACATLASGANAANGASRAPCISTSWSRYIGWPTSSCHMRRISCRGETRLQ